MSKLLEDPKVVALVEKRETKARKDAIKAALGVVKDAIERSRGHEDRNIKRELGVALRAVAADIKEAA